MSKELIIFILVQLITTIISTAKTVLTVEAGKTTAAVVNAVSYTLGAAITKLITKQDMEVVILVTFFSNLIGVYIAKSILEKTRKTRLWVINATVKDDLKTLIEDSLLERSIQYTLIEAKNHRNFFSIFSYSRGESTLIKEILESNNIRYSVISTELE